MTQQQAPFDGPGVLQDQPTALPTPMAALAAAARLAILYAHDAEAVAAASMLRAYGLRHNQQIAARAAAAEQRDAVAREQAAIAEGSKRHGTV
jgi:hypothetical protein